MLLLQNAAPVQHSRRMPFFRAASPALARWCSGRRCRTLSILRLCLFGGVGVHGQSAVKTYLFTDIEGSTRLWEQEPERMRPALARHDAIGRAAVEEHRGVVVKMTGDGVHAVFDDPRDAIVAAVQLQR